MNKQPAFIIAHKYIRGYKSYLNYYINNIQKFYDHKALIIVVDNNSTYKNEAFTTVQDTTNVVFLDNNSNCKFELGAYKIGLKYLFDNDKLNKISYIACTQDNFIIKNKLDFAKLEQDNILACPINSYYQDGGNEEIVTKVLNLINRNNNRDKITFCWCSSFILSSLKAKDFYEIVKDVPMTTRYESEGFERYGARILWELNNYKNNDIDGDLRNLQSRPNGYYCWTVDLENDNVDTFFAKVPQQKNERTVDK